MNNIACFWIIGSLAFLLLLALFAIFYFYTEARVAKKNLQFYAAQEERFATLSQQHLHLSQFNLMEVAQKEFTKKQELIAEMVGGVQKEIQEMEKERKEDQGALKEQLRALREAEKEIKDSTSLLARALHSSSSRGRWGEMQLKRIVELAGMLAYADFIEQKNIEVAGEKRRPDLTILLPNKRQLAVDAKVPLQAYLKALEIEEKESQKALFEEHAKSVRMHIQALAKKNYWDIASDSLEIVVLFLPSEAIYQKALEYDPALLEVSVGVNVFIATPTTLIALLKAIAHGWKEERISEKAAQIGEWGISLYKQLMQLSESWGKLGKSLSHTVEAYNFLGKQMEEKILPEARKIQEAAHLDKQILKKADKIEAKIYTGSGDF